MRTTRLSGFGLGVFCLFLSGVVMAGESPPYGPPTKPAQDPATPAKPVSQTTVYGVCFAMRGGGGQYVSAVFSAAVPAGTNPNQGASMVWRQAFGKYVIEKYGGGFAQCGAFSTQAEAQDYYRRLVGDASTRSPDTVETGWVYTAPPPEPTLPQAAMYAFCLTPASPRREIYFSPVVPKDLSLPPATLERSFAAHLASKYGYKTSVTCWDRQPIFPGEGASTMIREQKSKVQDYRSSGYTVIETDWKYTPVTKAPAAPAPAAQTPLKPAAPARPAAPAAAVAAAPKATYAVCWADSANEHTWYYSAVFDGTGSDYADWMPAFKKFLSEKYKYRSSDRCTKLPSRDEAQKYRDQMVSTARSTPMGDGSKRTVIETGWTYK